VELRRRIGNVFCAVVALFALATASAHAGANVWTSAGPRAIAIPPFERVDALAVDPVRTGTVYAATMRGDLFRTNDGGHTWSRVGPGAPVTAVAVGPTGIAYAATRSGTFRSTDGGRTWHEIRRPHPGAVLSIQVDPNDASVAYLTTVRSGSILDGDLLRSPDACLTWISIREGLGPGYVRAFAIDRFDSRRLYVVSESGFFVSEDSGAGWTRVANGLPTAELNAIAVDPNSRGTIYAAGAAGIFRSGDSGVSFSRIGAALPDPAVRSVVVDPLVPGRVFAAIDGHGVHVSTDGGDTWSPFADGLRGDLVTLAIHPAGRSIHAGTTEGAFDYALTSVAAPLVLNRDRPFRLRLTARDPRSGRVAVGHPIRQGDLFGYFSIPDLTSDADDPEVVVKLIDSRESDGSVALFYGALTDLEYELTVTEDDTGHTRVYSNACGGHDVLSLDRTPDLSKLTVQTAGRWVTGGPPAREVHALALDPTNLQTLYAAASQTSTRSVYRTTNGGGTWVPTGLSRQVTALGAGPSGFVYAGGVNANIFKSTDGGRNWREMRVYPQASSGIGIGYLRVDPQDPDVVYMGTYQTITVGGPPGGTLLRTLDGGLTWHSIQAYDSSPNGLGFGIVTDLAVDPDHPATLHAVKASGYYRSDDRGLHWSRMFLPLTDATALVLDPRFEGVIYVAGPSGLFKSIDGGRSFSRVGIGLPLGTARESGLFVGWPSRLVVDPSRSTRIFAAIYGRGVFVSEDGGETWADFNAGLQNLAVGELALPAEGNVLHAATFGGVFHNRFATESDTLSLNDRHPFRVRLTVRDQRTGRISAGRGTPLDDLFGYFTVPGLTTHADNPEVFVKVVDGRAVNGAFWFFHGALTDLEYTLTVTEGATSRVKTYSKPAGSACGGFDTSAFGP
jgi:photosystem II stability/assembly factor-like uncharacterized protein